MILGWLLDQLVEETGPKTLPDDLIAYQKIMRGTANQLDAISSDVLHHQVNLMSEYYQLNFALDEVENLALPQSLNVQLQTDKALMLESDTATHFYALLTAHPNSLLSMTIQRNIEPSNVMDVAFTLILYLGISLSLIVWLVPLTRRLSALNKTASQLGQGELTTRVALSRFSYIDGLEKSFNRMASQIEVLVADNKLLAGSLSHDLRTPVSCLRFGIEAAQNCNDLAQKDRYLVRIEQELTRLEYMLEAFLEYASMERQGFSLNPSCQSLVAFILLIVEELSPMAENKSIQVKVENNITADELVFDGHWLNRACVNLLSNAMDYCQQSVCIEINQRSQDYLINIHDDGQGVSEEHRESIFAAFFTSNQSRTRETTNFGLGLAIVKRVANWHGGSVTVKSSELLGGACFQLVLPKTSPLLLD